MPTTSTLVVIERIYRYQFKSIYLKDYNFFQLFRLNFRNVDEIFNSLKKKKKKKKMSLIGQVFVK